MTKRHLFLVGYDISDDTRRNRALRAVQAHALGGQKSFYECWLSIGELNELMQALRNLVDVDEDHVLVIRLDHRAESISIGASMPINDAEYFHIA
jgi:CRISPR-associated protein Cas2